MQLATRAQIKLVSLLLVTMLYYYRVLIFFFSAIFCTRRVFWHVSPQRWQSCVLDKSQGSYLTIRTRPARPGYIIIIIGRINGKRITLYKSGHHHHRRIIKLIHSEAYPPAHHVAIACFYVVSAPDGLPPFCFACRKNWNTSDICCCCCRTTKGNHHRRPLDGLSVYVGFKIFVRSLITLLVIIQRCRGYKRCNPLD